MTAKRVASAGWARFKAASVDTPGCSHMFVLAGLNQVAHVGDATGINPPSRAVTGPLTVRIFGALARMVRRPSGFVTTQGVEEARDMIHEVVIRHVCHTPSNQQRPYNRVVPSSNSKFHMDQEAKILWFSSRRQQGQLRASVVIFRTRRSVSDALYRTCWGCHWARPGHCGRTDTITYSCNRGGTLDRIWIGADVSVLD